MGKGCLGVTISKPLSGALRWEREKGSGQRPAGKGRRMYLIKESSGISPLAAGRSPIHADLKTRRDLPFDVPPCCVKKRLALALSGLALLTGCVSTKPIAFDTPEGRTHVNNLALHGCPVLKLAGQRGRQITALSITADVTTWIDRLTGEVRSAPTSTVEAVAFRRDGRGALKGAAIGLGTGVVLGLIAGADDDGGGLISFPTSTYVGVFGGTGGLIGALTGAIRSDRLIYRADPRGGSGLPSPQNGIVLQHLDESGVADPDPAGLTVTTCWRTR